MQACFSVDLTAVFGAAWVWGNIGFGLVVAIASVVVTRRYGSRIAASSWSRYLADNLAGTSLRDARRAIAVVQEFQAE
jgi:hypothetical protein